MKYTRSTLLALAVLLAGTSTAFAQEEPDQHRVPGIGRELTDQEQELVELFRDVERNLVRIDEDLGDAGAGFSPLDTPEDAGIEKLLRAALELSLETQSKIDRILAIAAEMNQKGGSGSGKGKPLPGGESPLDQARDTGPKQAENTPGAPEPKPASEEESQEPEHGDKPQDGEKPNPDSGRNEDGTPQRDARGERRSGGDDAEKWGFLPEHVREVFRNQGRDDLPVQYRDWIDAYYRRLNRSSR